MKLILSWSSDLKKYVTKRGNALNSTSKRFGRAFYRPFTAEYLYFDRNLESTELYQFPQISAQSGSNAENRTDLPQRIEASQKPFMLLMARYIPDLHLAGTMHPMLPLLHLRRRRQQPAGEHHRLGAGAVPGPLRRPSIDKWDIFHYVYALLHHPAYREKYAANLRRPCPVSPLPRISAPSPKPAHGLADLHVNYEAQPEYPLDWVENQDGPSSTSPSTK